MIWDVEYTDEFGAWWDTLTAAERAAIDSKVGLLIKAGPQLGFPHSSAILTSKHKHMRELRSQEGGRPLRTLYAFDPRRTAILLIGGDKTGNDRWYEEFVPVADRLYDDHLEQLRKEGTING
jgi:hypothetical protein